MRPHTLRLLCMGVLILSGCATPPPQACTPGAAGPSVWLVDRGWHTELLVPASAITGPLRQATGRFPAASFLAFGYGKRDWITAEEQDLLTLISGPIPGPGVVEITGRFGLPANAIRLPLGSAGMAGLIDFLTASLVDPAAAPVVVSRFGQHFHDARRSYSLAYTCNTWVAEALAAAGLAVRPAGVRLTSALLRQVAVLPQVCSV